MRVTEQQEDGKKKTRILFFGIIALCLVLAIAAVVVVRTYELKNVTFTGNTRYTEEELKERIFTEATDQISFLFYLRMKTKGTEEIPFIEKLETHMPDSHSIEIVVHEKLITGCVEQMGSYLYFDREGIVVESTRERLEDVPLVTGLRFSQIVLEEKLVVQKESLFQTILNLARLIEKQELEVTEIHFNSDYEVTLYVSGCEVFLGYRENYDVVLATLKSVLSSAEGRKLLIDMSNYEEGNGRITSTPLVTEGDEAGDL
ncbi:MAG: cell division protein FtsQ/DivIB [Lachnospiraceae bacterium]|nr:cell division protein FtsQ/DivIB [Lachnospiraceae bacterium]